MGQLDLNELLKGLPKFRDKNLLVGPEHGSDAGVYRVSPTQTIVQSADFFPPMVPDAFTFGQIAAANSLSDVYALGAKPATVMNLLGSPKDTEPGVLNAILQGAAAVTKESGAVLVGGHTVHTKEILFGLSVTGLCHPKRFRKNTTVKTGDMLVLTKPLGTGIAIHAFNSGALPEADLAPAIRCMTALNRAAGEAVLLDGVHASTDITGFGLIGHALDMISVAPAAMILSASSVPVLPQTLELAAAGQVPGGSRRNREATTPRTDAEGYVSSDADAFLNVLNDSQTSGGLLVSLAPTAVSKFQAYLRKKKHPFEAVVIGRVVPPSKDLPRGRLQVID